MVGPVEGDVRLAVDRLGVVDLAEADKGVHLVDVPPHVLAQPLGGVDVVVRAALEQAPVARGDAVRQTVQQRPLVRPAGPGQDLGELGKTFGQPHGRQVVDPRRVVGHLRPGKQRRPVRGRVHLRPRYVVGLHPLSQQKTQPRAERVEVGRELDVTRGGHGQCL